MTLRLNNDNNNSANIDYVDGVSTDSTITIPEGNGTVAMVGAGGGQSLAGNISRATIFRLETTHTTDGGALNSWQLPNEAGESGGLPNGVTHDAGSFTFPVTGIWMIQFTGTLEVASNDLQGSISTQITTDNGGSWDTRAQAVGGNINSAATSLLQTASSVLVMDVTSTADDHVRFVAATFAAGTSCRGDSTSNITTALFLRLGDT